MTAPRRRILRRQTTEMVPLVNPVRVQKLREKLRQEQQTLDRWMVRMRRAFHAVERQQRRVARLERSIAKAQ